MKIASIKVMGIKMMGKPNRISLGQLAQISSAMGLVIAGLIAPASASTRLSTLQSQAEEFSRSCVRQVAQPEAPSEIASSLAVCQQAIALTQITDNQRLEAYSLGHLGTLYLQQQDYQQALTFYQQTLTIAGTIDDSVLRTKALIGLGTVYLQSGQHQQALNFYQQALANAQSNYDPTGMAIAHYDLGLTYDTMGQYQQSVDAYQNAAVIAQEMGDPILEVYALNKMELASQALIEHPEQAVQL